MTLNMSYWKYPECVDHISKKLTPESSERTKIELDAQIVRKKIEETIIELGYSRYIIEVEYQGSFAKDTWLPGGLDLDLFILFKKSVNKDLLGELCREITYRAAEKLGAKVLKKYATHPYFTLVLGDGIEIDVVPAYYVRSAEEVVTPVDRTPLHTRYVKGVLEKNAKLKDEIRMFKKLLKNLKIYGAELKTQGFSGYLAEILIIHYGSLRNLLFHASLWRPWKTCIGRWKGVPQQFPLIVVDPVDSKRNVAAAVSVRSLSKLIGFALFFRFRPEILCCTLEKDGTIEVNIERIKDIINKGDYVFVQITNFPPMPEESLAGIYNRIVKKITRIAERSGFTVFRNKVIISENILLIFHLESTHLPRYTIHEGPPIWEKNSLSFILKWISESEIWPFVGEERWYIVKERKTRNFIEIVDNVLSSEKFPMKWKVYNDASFIESISPKSLSEIYEWITGREGWLSCIEEIFLKK